MEQKKEQKKKYNLEQMLAEIEDDIAAEARDLQQEVNISQPVITARLRQKHLRQKHVRQDPGPQNGQTTRNQ